MEEEEKTVDGHNDYVPLGHAHDLRRARHALEFIAFQMGRIACALEAVNDRQRAKDAGLGEGQ